MAVNNDGTKVLIIYEAFCIYPPNVDELFTNSIIVELMRTGNKKGFLISLIVVIFSMKLLLCNFRGLGNSNPNDKFSNLSKAHNQSLIGIAEPVIDFYYMYASFLYSFNLNIISTNSRDNSFSYIWLIGATNIGLISIIFKS